jgi:ActR/RegA family two-component response regulator
MWALFPGWLSTNAIKLIGYATAALSVSAILLGAREAGRTAEKYDQLQKAMEIKNAQLNATLNAPHNRDQLVDQLRDGKF